MFSDLSIDLLIVCMNSISTDNFYLFYLNSKVNYFFFIKLIDLNHDFKLRSSDWMSELKFQIPSPHF